MVWVEEAFGDNFIEQLMEEREAGHVRTQTHPEDPCLQIFNYTDKAVYDRHWNNVTMNCRGLILAVHDGLEYSVVARPFSKFFNHGEISAPVFDLSDPVEVTDKLDGSLGILYFDINDEPAIATRGSFESDQAIHATAVLRERYYDWAKTRSRDWTLLFEIVYPENRIVVDYDGMDDLVSLGAVHKLTGKTRGPLDLSPMPYAETFPYATFADALAAPTRDGKEGMVIRKVGTEDRVKLKQEEYIRLHRIVTNLNERAVWEIVKTQNEVGLNEWIAELPDEFHSWANEVSTELFRKFLEIQGKILEDYRQVCIETNAQPGGYQRKNFATFATKTLYPWAMFSELDGRDYSSKIWDMIRPEAFQTPHGRTVEDE